jgi:hypothetical protein
LIPLNYDFLQLLVQGYFFPSRAAHPVLTLRDRHRGGLTGVARMGQTRIKEISA